MNKNQHDALYNSYVQIKTLTERENITLVKKHVTIITIFRHVLSNNSLITLYTDRNPYPTP